MGQSTRRCEQVIHEAQRSFTWSCVLTCLLFSMTLSGCVNHNEYMILVYNHTDEEIDVRVRLVDTENGTTAIDERMHLEPQGLKKIKEFPPLVSGREYHLYAETEGGESGPWRVRDACGVCTDEVHVRPDGIRFGNSIS